MSPRVWGDGWGEILAGGKALSRDCGEMASLDDLVAKVELFLFQGQKGDPGLSPGKAHDGAKVGFQGPPALREVGEWTGGKLPCPASDHGVTGRGGEAAREEWGLVFPLKPFSFPHARSFPVSPLGLQAIEPAKDFANGHTLGEGPLCNALRFCRDF